MIAHASIDERGKISGGKSGDQNGKEVCIRPYYQNKWNVVVRLKMPSMRQKVADCMVKAANNPAIGYDQSNRNSLLNYAKIYNYDVSKITTPCETDCSALVTVACIAAGIRENSLVVSGNCSTTSTLRKRLQATGAVEVFTDREYTSTDKNLVVGDILIREGYHTAVVVQTDAKKSTKEIALEIIDGKWGTGDERKKRLTNAGYNYAEVQAEVNRILR
jgi:hypothetical protein